MLSPQKFASIWGEDRYCFPLTVLESINIPRPAKSFLQEAGLPLRAEVPLGFYVVPLPFKPATPPVQAAKHPLLSRYLSTQFLLLAYLHYKHYKGDEIYYAIEENTGIIYRVGPGVHIKPGRLVNSSLAQFAECLLAYREFLTHFEPIEPPRSEVHRLVAALGQKWRQIDVVAMGHADNYWPMGLDDIEVHV